MCKCEPAGLSAAACGCSERWLASTRALFAVWHEYLSSVHADEEGMPFLPCSTFTIRAQRSEDKLNLQSNEHRRQNARLRFSFQLPVITMLCLSGKCLGTNKKFMWVTGKDHVLDSNAWCNFPYAWIFTLLTSFFFLNNYFGPLVVQNDPVWSQKWPSTEAACSHPTCVTTGVTCQSTYMQICTWYGMHWTLCKMY